jgi:hypothetical protein
MRQNAANPISPLIIAMLEKSFLTVVMPHVRWIRGTNLQC